MGGRRRKKKEMKESEKEEGEIEERSRVLFVSLFFSTQEIKKNEKEKRNELVPKISLLVSA